MDRRKNEKYIYIYIYIIFCISENRKPSKLVVDLKGSYFKIKSVNIHEGFQPDQKYKLTGDLSKLDAYYYFFRFSVLLVSE